MKYVYEINKYAKQGDILLLGSSNPLGYLIRYAQKTQTKDGKPSLWSHCALWFDEDTIIESTIDIEKYETGSRFDNGVQYNEMCRIEKYDRILLLQYKLNDLQRELIIRRAHRLYKQGITYPILGLFGSLLSYWLFRWESNPLQTKHSLYCSAFIQECYDAVEIDFDRRHTARNTSPEAIYQHNDSERKMWWIK